DQTDLVFKNVTSKYRSVVEDIAQRHEKGQPVLVGTTSVENSEIISDMLKKRRIPHDVLNAKQHEREAHVVAMAGRKGAVTVATNMAGRGTDIMLGGNAEFLAVEEMRRRGFDAVEDPEAYEAAWPEILAASQDAVAQEHDEVVNLGGLYVLGTERHESRRIDNQLRGRSGRQGDPGESRFYLSMQDDLMRMFATGAAERIMNSSLYPDDMPLEAKIVSNSIQSAQSQVEARNSEIRKNVLKYDDVMSKQREAVYATRFEILSGEDIEDKVEAWLDTVLEAFVGAHATSPNQSDWNLEGLFTELKTLYPVSITAEDIIEEAGGLNRVTSEMLLAELSSDIHLQYQQREEQIGAEQMRALERRVVLSVLDRKWREHLYEMDYLKEGIGLRVMAQRDPVVEYRNEGYAMFQAMDEAIKEESVRYLFNIEIKKPEEEAASVTVGGAPATAANIAAKLAGAATSTTAGSVGGVGAGVGAGAGAGAGASRSGSGSGSGDGGASGGAYAASAAGRPAAPRSAAGSAATAGSGADGEVRSRAGLTVRGLEPPKASANLTYSSSAQDGSGATQSR
nr:preprotein translocase subunit SecA [Actinomycetales bacterium]